MGFDQSMILEERLAPHSLEAERAVLGSIMLEGSLYEQSAAMLNSDDFYLESHRTIFTAFERVAKDGGGGAIDLTTITEAVRIVATNIEEVGGKAYLSSLIDGLPRYSNIENYCKIVREKASLRRLISAATALMNDAYADDGQSSTELAERHFERISAITARGGSVKLRWLSETESMMQKDLERTLRVREDESLPDEIDCIPAPYKALKRYRPFPKESLSIIAGRPSMGKSMFAIDLGLKLAEDGYRYAHFSREDTESRIHRRMLANLSGVELAKLYMPRNMSDIEFNRYAMAQDKLQELPIAITERISFGTNHMIALIRDAHRRKGLDFVVVDYAQRFYADDKMRYQVLGDLAEKLRDIAGELGISVILVAQLNRSSSARDKSGKVHRPEIDDLKESGNLEESADVVILLHNWNYYDAEKRDEMGKTEIIIGKNKNGPRGLEELYFDGKTQRIRDITDDDYAEEL